MGFAVAASGGGGNFQHPFKTTFTSDGMLFAAGVVNGLMPVIKVNGTPVPIIGDSKHAQPLLKLDSKAIDRATLQSWACIEVTPNADGSLDAKSLIEIVHRDSPFSNVATVGRQPVALILWTAALKPGRVFPQLWFNLRYYRTNPPAGGGAPKHFFL